MGLRFSCYKRPEKFFKFDEKDIIVRLKVLIFINCKYNIFDILERYNDHFENCILMVGL